MRVRVISLASLLVMMAAALVAQSPKTPAAGVITGQELKQLVPETFFYAGKTAPTQLRNSSAVRSQAGKIFLAGMVDVSGYSTGIAEKYQGFLITEAPIKIGGQELKPGAYGFGTLADGKFLITDVGANEVFSVPMQNDAQLRRAMPLKITSEAGKYRLYLGKKYVEIDLE